MIKIKLENWTMAILLPGLITACLGCASTNDDSPTEVVAGSDLLARPCTPDITLSVPSEELLARFAGTQSGPPFARHTLLSYPMGSPMAPDFTLTNGGLHITMNRPALTQNQYLGVVLATEGHCIDATEYSGVTFSISGSFKGCSMHYFSIDEAHQDMTTGALIATGPAGSFAPTIGIAQNQVTPIPKTINAAFSAQSGGNPPTPIDKSKIILFAWQFEVPASRGTATDPCIADITISNVMFYR